MLLAMLGFAQPAGAILRIEITQGVAGALPIAVPTFTVAGQGGVSVDVASVVAADLTRSGRLQAVEREAFPAAAGQSETPDFAAWREQGIEYLLRGAIQPSTGNKLSVRFRLFDTVTERRVLGRRIPADPAQLRQAAHLISDIVFEHLTGVRGAFSTRIAYVTVTGEQADQRYHLQIADADGQRPREVYRSSEPIMSPAWSPDGKRLAYVTFRDGRARIQIQELASGQTRQVLAKPGINGAPAWSPDGEQLAVTLSFPGNPEIYRLDLAAASLTRLTRHRAIDTEPAWTNDGQAILFTSDRSGGPQIYRLPVTGGEPRRVSFQGRYNAHATPMPNTEQAAIVHAQQGHFRIALLDLQTHNIRVLTDGDLDESPSVAPNGSMILYASRAPDGRGVLAAVSADGRFRQRLRLLEGEVREPAWSPFGDG